MYVIFAQSQPAGDYLNDANIYLFQSCHSLKCIAKRHKKLIYCIASEVSCHGRDTMLCLSMPVQHEQRGTGGDRYALKLHFASDPQRSLTLQNCWLGLNYQETWELFLRSCCGLYKTYINIQGAQSSLYLCNCLDNDLRGHTLRTNPSTQIKQIFEADLTADVKSLLVTVKSKLVVAYNKYLVGVARQL